MRFDHAGSLRVLLCSLGCLAEWVCAQPSFSGDVFEIAPDRVETLVIRAGAVNDGGYAHRSVPVLDTLSGLFENATRQLMGCTHILDDYSFDPGPWASPTRRIASSWSCTMFYSEWRCPQSSPVKLRAKFYDQARYGLEPDPYLIPPDLEPIADISYNIPEGFFDDQKPAPGYIVNVVFEDIPLRVAPNEQDLVFAGNAFLLEISLEDPERPGVLAWCPSYGSTIGFYVPECESITAPSQLWGLVMVNKGSTSIGRSPDIFYGRDVDGDGRFSNFTSNPFSRSERRTNANRCIPLIITPAPCPCPADFDNSGGTPDIGDVHAYLAAWLAGDDDADADCSGLAPDSTDLRLFFDAWLAGGC